MQHRDMKSIFADPCIDNENKTRFVHFRQILDSPLLADYLLQVLSHILLLRHQRAVDSLVSVRTYAFYIKSLQAQVNNHLCEYKTVLILVLFSYVGSGAAGKFTLESFFNEALVF